MDLGLTNARVIVTGATGGVGAAIVRELASEGCRLAICARNANKLLALRNLYEPAAIRYCSPVDVTDQEAFGAWCGEALRALGGLDILIWTVSAQSRHLLESFEVEIVAFDMAIQRLRSAFESSSKAAIVAIGSQAGLLAVANYASYSAAKAALLSYCGSRARDLAAKGIRLNVLSPGDLIFQNSIWDQIRRERPERYQSALKRHVLGRMGRPEEIAPAAAFLASPRASLIAGANLLVDGMSREFVHF